MLPSPEEMKSGPALRNPVAVGLPSLILMPISGNVFDSPLQERHPSMCVGWTVLEMCLRTEGLDFQCAQARPPKVYL